MSILRIDLLSEAAANLRKLFFILFIAVIAIAGVGCSSERERVELLGNEELRAAYAAVPEFEMGSRIRAFSMDAAIKRYSIIIMATPLNNPESFLKPGTNDPSTNYDYKKVQMEIIEVLKGDLSDKIISISVPSIPGAFMDVLRKGDKYIMCIAPAEYAGEGQWGAATDYVFYVSESNQIVPMIDDEGHNEVLGITVESFKNRYLRFHS